MNRILLFILMIALTANSAVSQTIDNCNKTACKHQQMSCRKVYSCLDIIKNIDTTGYRTNYVGPMNHKTRESSVETTYGPIINFDYTAARREHLEKFATLVDEMGLINYGRDTIYIEESHSDTWNGRYDYRDHYFLTITTHKGIYDLKRKKLIQRIYENAQETFEADSINPDALPAPGSYAWEMLRFRCWDDNMMIKYFGDTCYGYSIKFVRIIIKDNTIVYCDRWRW